VDDVVGACARQVGDGLDFRIVLTRSRQTVDQLLQRLPHLLHLRIWLVMVRVRLEYWMSFCRLDTSMRS
jgi:hypothetical protein